MKKLFLAALLALTAFCTLPITASAQIANGPDQFGFAFAADYGKWFLHSSGDVGTGAVTIIVREGSVDMATQSGRPFRPLATNAPVLIDAGGAHPETLTPSAVTCAQGALTCSFAVTTIYAHVGNFSIQSGTFGLAEAYNAILAQASGGIVVVANGFGGTTTTITTTFPAGSAAVPILDVRGGAFQFYASSGSTYSASFNAASRTIAMGVGRFQESQGTTIVSGSCSSGDCTLPGDGNFFIVSGTTTVDGFSTAGWQAGSVIRIMTSGSITFNDGGTVAAGFGAMKLTGALSMTADDILTLVFDGTSWVEASLAQN